MAYEDNIRAVQIFLGPDGTVFSDGSKFPAQTAYAYAYSSSDISSGASVIGTTLASWPFLTSTNLDGLTIYVSAGPDHPYSEDGGVISENILFILEFHGNNRLSMTFGPQAGGTNSYGVTLPDEGGRIDFSEWRFDSYGPVSSGNAGTYYQGYIVAQNGVYTPPQPTPTGPYYPRDPSEPGYCRHDTPRLTDRIHEYVYNIDRYAGDLYGRDNQVAMYYRLEDGTPDRLALTALAEITSTLVEYIRIMVVDYDEPSAGTRLPSLAQNVYPLRVPTFIDAFPEYNDPAFPDGRYVMELESGRYVLSSSDDFASHNVHAIIKTWRVPEIERVRRCRNPTKYADHIFGFDLKMVDSVREFNKTVDPESRFLCAHHRYRVYIWGFSPMNRPCDISYVEYYNIGPVSKKMRAYDQDNRIYLVDTPCGLDHNGEETRGESWDDSSTEHTLENAFYFARDGATIRFDSALMVDEEIPVVCEGLNITTNYGLTIDALLPYKVEGDSIVIDSAAENWKGVLIQNSELSFDARSVHTSTSGTDVVALLTTVQGVTFKYGHTGIYSQSPCRIDRCSFDGFLDEAVFISCIYRNYYVAGNSLVISEFDDPSAITHSVFTNCGHHTACFSDDDDGTDDGIVIYSYGGALHGGDGPVVDNCLFVNNNHIKNYGTLLNCTIIAPSGSPGEPGEEFPETYLYPEKSDANYLYCLHAINCFVAGYPIQSDSISTATNSVVLHTWEKPEQGDEEVDGKMSYDKYYDAFLVGWRHNEVYDCFGEEGSVTVADFLYDNYHPRSTSEEFSVINKGTNQYIDLWNITTDLAGNPRVNEEIVDIGCFEWVSCMGLRVDGYTGVYDGYPHPVISVFDTSTTEILGDDLTSQATLYIVPDEIIIRDPEQVDDYLTSMVPDEVYLPGTIPTITHAPNEIYETEYIWDQERSAIVTAPGGKFWAGTLRAYVTPRPLYVENMTITRK